MGLTYNVCWRAALKLPITLGFCWTLVRTRRCPEAILAMSGLLLGCPHADGYVSQELLINHTCCLREKQV